MWKHPIGIPQRKEAEISTENSPLFPPKFRREIMRKFPQKLSLEFPYKTAWKSGRRRIARPLGYHLNHQRVGRTI